MSPDTSHPGAPDTHAADLAALDALFATRGAERRVAPGSTIEAQGATVHTILRLRRGCVRSCIYTKAGDRKILSFRAPGDVLGLDAGTTWPAAQEAVETVILDVLPRTAFDRALEADPALQRAVRAILSAMVADHARLLVLTACAPAVDRVRAFLAAHAARRRSPGFVALPMGRRDIADHLGLSMETVSRSFTALRDAGDLDLNGAAFYRLTDRAPETPLAAAA